MPGQPVLEILTGQLPEGYGAADAYSPLLLPRRDVSLYPLSDQLGRHSMTAISNQMLELPGTKSDCLMERSPTRLSITGRSSPGNHCAARQERSSINAAAAW